MYNYIDVRINMCIVSYYLSIFISPPRCRIDHHLKDEAFPAGRRRGPGVRFLGTWARRHSLRCRGVDQLRYVKIWVLIRIHIYIYRYSWYHCCKKSTNYDYFQWVNTYRYFFLWDEPGWTSIYQLFWGSLGTRVLTHPHMYDCCKKSPTMINYNWGINKDIYIYVYI